MRERGSGSLFRERYRDKRTGQVKTCQTWTMKLWVGGRPLKRSAGTTSRAVANKRLEAWKAAIQQGIYVPDAEQTAASRWTGSRMPSITSGRSSRDLEPRRLRPNASAATSGIDTVNGPRMP